eukprot:825659-Prymnesium_polylepis.2
MSDVAVEPLYPPELAELSVPGAAREGPLCARCIVVLVLSRAASPPAQQHGCAAVCGGASGMCTA